MFYKRILSVTVVEKAPCCFWWLIDPPLYLKLLFKQGKLASKQDVSVH